jgi:hypothetical protein
LTLFGFQDVDARDKRGHDESITQGRWSQLSSVMVKTKPVKAAPTANVSKTVPTNMVHVSPGSAPRLISVITPAGSAIDKTNVKTRPIATPMVALLASFKTEVSHRAGVLVRIRVASAREPATHDGDTGFLTSRREFGRQLNPG